MDNAPQEVKRPADAAIVDSNINRCLDQSMEINEVAKRIHEIIVGAQPEKDKQALLDKPSGNLLQAWGEKIATSNELKCKTSILLNQVLNNITTK